jgi:hypothetical protein
VSSARSDLMEIKTIVDSRPHESPSAAAANKRQSSMASPVLARHANRQFRLTLCIKDHAQCMSNTVHVNCEIPLALVAGCAMFMVLPPCITERK